MPAEGYENTGNEGEQDMKPALQGGKYNGLPLLSARRRKAPAFTTHGYPITPFI
jgi:hypothetical protein